MMRVLVCSNAYPPHFMGGAELMAHEQAMALARLGHEVRVFAGEPGSGRARHARADGRHEGLRLHRIALEPEDYSPEYLNFLHPEVERHFGDVLQEFAPDIVHCHNLMGLSVKLPILARQYGAATVCTLHDFWGFCLRNTAVRADGRTCDDDTRCRECLPRIHDGRRAHVSMRWRKDFIGLALDQVDRFIAPSRFLAGRYIAAGWPAERLEVIPNGIALDRFRPAHRAESGGGPVRITYAGYFGAHKGVATLIDALAMLDAPGQTPPGAVLELVGDGPEREAYVARIAALGLQARVHFPGKAAPEEMPGIYAGSDIVVLPSVWDENQPVCLMEAMAAGLPVVASRRGGIPELVEHGVNGLLFAAGDAGDLAAELARLVADPDLRRRMGSEGRRRVDDMSHERQARRLETIYAQVAQDRASHGTRDLVHTREVYAVIGGMQRKMAGEDVALADRRYPSRRFLPLEWLSECRPAIAGILVTGRLWSALRLLKVDAILPLPGPVRRRMRRDRARPPESRGRLS